ncbi:hypothetical protein AA103196_0264 [Ameyamaea chiangmaiensis NBRC 103196]|uniref:PIN domain-containing protein n=1 Tax=Ameyamaea chiangmaiensis TaxID=442969 RepID=A0A850PBI9_9PROT|nr:hypothetical protein [Ameyamaea chiangmaiensis]MBS4075577.1 hypothetical protein [Ameyamaea chiangmaiensis]NVN40293.1 hypothetical protein [Ameyamaea chiangmaiensis]GBQ62267.1 hypothetical protein AA103196_0264 [Ameyamaea chiangmaiensis NBRC 103196]
MVDYFWDSCALIEYLNDDNDTDKKHNLQWFLNDAKNGKCKIHISTISLAEILPSRIVNGIYGNIDNFLSDFQGHLIPVTPNTNIMRMAAKLRDQQYQKFVSQASGYSSPRRLDSPDAIILASAVYLEKANGIKFEAFHTYDNGGKRRPEGGKSVPILSIEEWCRSDLNYDSIVADVIALTRQQPLHSNPQLYGV